MIKLENCEITGWEHAIRGMRNPMNSWEKSEGNLCSAACCREGCQFNNSPYCIYRQCYKGNPFVIGSNDHELMLKLAKNGSVHAKYRRMITVYVDITAPLYWWKEFDTYKVGTVANSCSTMHKIHEKRFALEDFSCEHLTSKCEELLLKTIDMLNLYRILDFHFVDSDDYFSVMREEFLNDISERGCIKSFYECPSCGSLIPYGTKYCLRCGVRIDCSE